MRLFQRKYIDKEFDEAYLPDDEMNQGNVSFEKIVGMPDINS